MTKNSKGVAFGKQIWSPSKISRRLKATKNQATFGRNASIAKTTEGAEKLAKEVMQKVEDTKTLEEKVQSAQNKINSVNQLQKALDAMESPDNQEKLDEEVDEFSKFNIDEQADTVTVASTKSAKNSSMKKRFRNRNFDTVFAGREEEALKRMFAAEERLNTQLGVNKKKSVQ